MSRAGDPGEQSDTFRIDAAERLKRRIADYEFASIADAGHFVPMGKPQECARVITDFIHHFNDETIS